MRAPRVLEFGYADTTVEICFTSAEISAAVKRHRAAGMEADIKDSVAFCTFYRSDEGAMLGLLVVVADRVGDLTPIQIAALISHEAVHVMQSMREKMGESEPGWEWEAYTVQYVAQAPMVAWAEFVAQAQ